MLVLAILLIVYSAVVFWILVYRPAKVWKMGKIQGFIKILGEWGTRVLFILVALISLVLGIIFLIKSLK